MLLLHKMASINKTQKNTKVVIEPTPSLHDILQKLPEEPEGEIDAELQAKIKREIERKNESGVAFTDRLKKRKDFENPYYLSLIVELKSIYEWGSNYPKSKFDPNCDAEFFKNKFSFAPPTISRSLSSSRTSRVPRSGPSSQRRPLLKRNSSVTAVTTSTGTSSKKTGKKRKWDNAAAPVASSSAASASSASSASTAASLNDMKAMIAKAAAKRIEASLVKKKKLA